MAIIRRLVMARYRPGAFPCCRPWRDCAPMRSRRGLGRENAGSRQHIACMYSDTASFGKICAPCIRKAPQSAVGERTARTSCRQGAFSPSEALRSCTAHESCRPPVALPPAQGLLPEQLHRGIAFQRFGPCSGGGAYPGAPPIPATCQCLPLAVPIAARDKPPMSFGGGHPAHGLQSGQAPRDRRLRHLDGQADNGMLRRTGPGFRNREQVGAEPPAEAAGRAGPAPALPKTPIERTGPSWRNHRNTASISHCAKKPTPRINPRVSFICVLSCIQPVRVSSCFTLGSFSAGCRPFFRLAPAAQQRFGASKLAVASLQGTTFRQSASPTRRLTLATRYWTSAFHRPCRLQYSYTATGSSPGTTAKSALGSSPGWRCFTWKPFEVSSTIMVMK